MTLWEMLLRSLGDAVYEVVKDYDNKHKNYAIIVFEHDKVDEAVCVSNAETEERLLQALDLVRSDVKNKIILQSHETGEIH